MFRHLVMMCPSLVDQGGHEHDYTLEVAEAAMAAGTQVKTFVPPAAQGLALPGIVIRTCPANGMPMGTAARLANIVKKIGFYFAAFRAPQDGSTLFFIHSISQRQLAVVALGWIVSIWFSRNRETRKLTLFLRHQLGHSRGDWVQLHMLRLGGFFNISFVSDSDLLADSLMPRLGHAIDVLPIPVTRPEGIIEAGMTPLCSYFGARRVSKGFQFLPPLVEAGAQSITGVHFVIQAYRHRDDGPDQTLADAMERLGARTDTRLIDKTLSNTEFADLAFKTRLALIPYDPETYRFSTSGNFVLSVVARSVVVTTEGGWMAHQAQKYKMTRVVLLPWPPTMAQSENAMQRAAGLLAAPDMPSDEEEDWCRRQNPAALWDILCRAANKMRTSADESV